MTSRHISSRLMNHAVDVAKIADLLPRSTAGQHVASLLIHSSTALIPAYDNARSAGKRGDVIERLGDTLHELRQTLIWLHFVDRAGLAGTPRVRETARECKQLCDIMARSIGIARAMSAQGGMVRLVIERGGAALSSTQPAVPVAV